MKKISLLLGMLFNAAILSIVSSQSALECNGAYAQDLMAMQAPIDVKLRAVDSVKIRQMLRIEDLENPSSDLYQSWNNKFVNYASQQMPAEYKVDLRDFHMPCDSRIVNSHYGYRRQFRRTHYGTDLKAYMGDTIRAAFSGKVRLVKYEAKGFGKYVVIRHANGLETIYGHLSKQLVNEDQTVKAGEVIGLAGNTGRSTGPHLHFETRLLGEKIDPEKIFCFEAGDVRGDYYVYRRNGHSQIMDAHDVKSISNEENLAQIAKAEESHEFQQKKMQQQRQNRQRVYKVRKGDTLSRIAKKHGTTVERLCRLNHLSRNTTLRLGQIIKCS